jgi:hypothetical protein
MRGELTHHSAYRLIKDDLTLDGTPTLNLASFVTTYMEEEAEKLMVYVQPRDPLERTSNRILTATPSRRTSSTTKSTPSAPTSRTVRPTYTITFERR